MRISNTNIVACIKSKSLTQIPCYQRKILEQSNILYRIVGTLSCVLCQTMALHNRVKRAKLIQTIGLLVSACTTYAKRSMLSFILTNGMPDIPCLSKRNTSLELYIREQYTQYSFNDVLSVDSFMWDQGILTTILTADVFQNIHVRNPFLGALIPPSHFPRSAILRDNITA